MKSTLLMERRAKIVATIGPVTNNEHMIISLIEAGMNVARINFSHGSHEEHAQSIKWIRKASNKLGKPITILQDLQGPKIRTGEIKDGQVLIKPGEIILLTTDDVLGNGKIIPVDYKDLPNTVIPNGRILIDDGNLELKVISISSNSIETEVVEGGILKSNKGINLPAAKINIQALTEKDVLDLKFGLEHDVDAVALSFVRSSDDILLIKKIISEIRPDRTNIQIIAKIERPEALDNLHEIIHAADGVMVARGDLGVEMSPESVPIAQKEIIQTANRHIKIVITATQMLESMINNPRPTRAEASDVANAILDGSDAVMLSGETAVGRFPIKAVQMMNAIICQAERHSSEWGQGTGIISEDVRQDDALYITKAARELAKDRDVSAIAVFTSSGRTARIMSKARPEVPILAFTPEEGTYKRLPLMWGVLPHLIPRAETMEEMLTYVEAAIITDTDLKPGQEVVLIAGYPIGSMGPANFALLHTLEQR